MNNLTLEEALKDFKEKIGLIPEKEFPDTGITLGYLRIFEEYLVKYDIKINATNKEMLCFLMGYHSNHSGGNSKNVYFFNRFQDDTKFEFHQ